MALDRYAYERSGGCGTNGEVLKTPGFFVSLQHCLNPKGQHSCHLLYSHVSSVIVSHSSAHFLPLYHLWFFPLPDIFSSNQFAPLDALLLIDEQG